MTVKPRSWACANLAHLTACRLAAAAPSFQPLPAQLVPRVIHQTHKVSRAELPPGLRAAVATWDALNPEYEHVYYSEAAMAAYVAARAPLFPGFQQAYDKLPLPLPLPLPLTLPPYYPYPSPPTTHRSP